MSKTLARNTRAIASALKGAPAEWRIEGAPGLILDVSGDGKGSWRLRFRPQRGANKTTKTLGDARVVELGDALAKARALMAGLQIEGIDPRGQPQKASSSFDDTYALWLKRYAKVHKKSWEADEKLYLRHVKQRLGSDIVRDIDRPRVIEVLDDIASKATPLQANRCQSLISAILSWALDEGRINAHPALRIRRRGEERQRELIMDDEQLVAFWSKLDELFPNARLAIRLLLLTGQRLSEVVEADRSELRLAGEAPVWTIPGVRTKNGLTHAVPLTPMSAALFSEALVAAKNNPFVFPARRQEPSALDGNQVSRQCKSVFREIGAANMRLHDLRHQAATGMAQSGVPLDIRQLVQNQVTGRRASIGARYDQHDYATEKRRALTLWEVRLLAIAGGAAAPIDRW